MAWVTTRAPINVKTTLLDAVWQFKQICLETVLDCSFTEWKVTNIRIAPHLLRPDLYQVSKAQIQVQSTCICTCNSRSSTTQVLEQSLGGDLWHTNRPMIEFYSTETAKVFERWRWWYVGRIRIHHLLLAQFKELNLRIRRSRIRK